MDDILLFYIICISLPLIAMILSQTRLKDEIFLMISGTFIAVGGVTLGSVTDQLDLIGTISVSIFFVMTLISLGPHVKRIFRGNNHA